MKRRKFLEQAVVGSAGLAAFPALVHSVPERRSPAEEGTWEVLPQRSEVLAVHAALLHTGQHGQILYFGGDEHDRGRHNRNQIDHTRLFDCATSEIVTLPSPTTDVFCSGHAFLPDGRLLVAGGTEAFSTQDPSEYHHGHFPGLRASWVFDPDHRVWSRSADMSGGRWYPTLVSLPPGRVLALCGHPGEEDGRHNNNSLELFDPAGAGNWVDLGRAATSPIRVDWDNLYPYPMYPRVHMLPDGSLFCATPMPLPDSLCWKWNPGSLAWSPVAPGPGAEYNLWPTPTGPEANTHKGMTSVLLPLLPEDGYRPRVLVFGATQPKIIDLGGPNPAWSETSPRALRLGSSTQPPVRYHAGCVLLPDGSALVVGGSQGILDTETVRIDERYDPGTGRWSTLAEAAVPRQYHSVALLMPDGRVWTAGSNHDHKQSFRNTLTSSDADEPGVDNRELRIELFTPPYLFRGPRPTIAAAPGSLALPTTFEIDTPDARRVQRVALMRCGSVTHAFDFDQRYIGLAILRRGATAVTVASPPDTRVAPPGYYLLFLITEDGVPSVGRFTRVVE
jgi:hypothetical protein